MLNFKRAFIAANTDRYNAITEEAVYYVQGGNGLAAAQTSVVAYEPCATDENAFNYELQRPITEEFYELFKPFGYINKELGNKRLGEVYVLNKAGKVVLVLQGRMGSTKNKVNSDPEDKSQSPFANLGLVKNTENLYSQTSPKRRDIDEWVYI